MRRMCTLSVHMGDYPRTCLYNLHVTVPRLQLTFAPDTDREASELGTVSRTRE